MASRYKALEPSVSSQLQILLTPIFKPEVFFIPDSLSYDQSSTWGVAGATKKQSWLENKEGSHIKSKMAPWFFSKTFVNLLWEWRDSKDILVRSIEKNESTRMSEIFLILFVFCDKQKVLVSFDLTIADTIKVEIGFECLMDDRVSWKSWGLRWAFHFCTKIQ